MGEALLAQTVKNPPAMWETWVQSLHWEDPLEKGMATHSSILAWIILWQRSLASYSPWNSPGQNTGVGSLSLLQRIFSAQGLNPGLPRCRQILYHLSHQGSPRIQEWRAYAFCRESSQPRNRTGVSCIAGGFFTYWAMRFTSYLERGWWWCLSL